MPDKQTIKLYNQAGAVGFVTALSIPDVSPVQDVIFWEGLTYTLDPQDDEFGVSDEGWDAVEEVWRYREALVYAAVAEDTITP